MRPELIFHTEGFVAGSALAALASHRADVLLRQFAGATRIRWLVIFQKLPSGAGLDAARGEVEGPGGEAVAIEVAHDPDAAILRAFARLGRRLAGQAAGSPPPAG